MSLVAALSPRRQFPMLLLLCFSLLCIQSPGVSSSLSFDIQFTQYGFDPQMVLFHQMSPKNLSASDKPYTAHRRPQVLPRKKRKKFVPDSCDCSRINGVMYARPAPLRLPGEATAADEVASFKMTLCLKIDRGAEAAMKSHSHGVGLFLFLVPYPWNAHDERIEVGIDSNCTETLMDSVGGEALVCAHLHYDPTTELLLSTVRVGDGFCMAGRKLNRSGMPKQAAVGFGSTTAGDPIKLGSILTWAFHSTLNLPPMAQPPREATGDAGSRIIEREQRLRVDPWNRNAEFNLLNLRYQENWLHNFQLTCSISISVAYGNAV